MRAERKTLIHSRPGPNRASSASASSRAPTAQPIETSTTTRYTSQSSSPGADCTASSRPANRWTSRTSSPWSAALRPRTSVANTRLPKAASQRDEPGTQTASGDAKHSPESSATAKSLYLTRFWKSD